MTKATKMKWNDELAGQAVEMYGQSDKSKEAVTQIGVDLGGFPFRSVVSKLAQMGVYEKQEKVRKAPVDEGPTKKELLNALEGKVDFDVDGLKGATRDALKGLVNFVEARS